MCGANKRAEPPALQHHEPEKRSAPCPLWLLRIRLSARDRTSLLPCEAGSCSLQSLLLRSSSRERRSASPQTSPPHGRGHSGSSPISGCRWMSPRVGCVCPGAQACPVPVAPSPQPPASPTTPGDFLLMPLWPRGSVRPHLRRSSSPSFLASDCQPLCPAPGLSPRAPPSPGALQHLLERLPELWASESIDERVHDGVADDKGQEEVEVPEDAVAGGVLRTEDDEQEVQEEGAPAEEEDAQQGGESGSPFEAEALGGRALPLVQPGDATGVLARLHQHADVQHRHERQQGHKEADQTEQDGRVVVVGDEEGAGDDAGHPDARDGPPHPGQRHDAVVAQRIEDGDVPVHGDGGQEAEAGHHGATDEHVQDVIQLLHRGGLGRQRARLQQQHNGCAQHVAHAHQQVRYGQAADEEVHGRVQVAVLGDGGHHQHVLHQAHQPQAEEEPVGNGHLQAPGARLVGGQLEVGGGWGGGVEDAQQPPLGALCQHSPPGKQEGASRDGHLLSSWCPQWGPVHPRGPLTLTLSLAGRC
uniref:Uncharacterized protein n=1 Tax=Myotis myotis TaxID=51298 RepID=A0A7J7R4M5_MYOMY|nr:hypothetical protein mMyoMyo1_010898 [Myotis myotis]